MTKWKARLFVFWRQNTCTDECLDEAITAHTLRRVVAMVKRLPRYRQGTHIMLTTHDGGSPWICVDDLLASLQRMKEDRR